jgi:peptide deformylase
VNIVRYPAPTLSERSLPLGEPPADLVEKLQQMFRIMYGLRGVGLAAPQVGWNVRLFIKNADKDRSKETEKVYIDPEIIETPGDEAGVFEGCLSLPNVWAKIRRHTAIRVRAKGVDGVPFEETLEGVDAQAAQHEMDHLNGMLIIERMTPADLRQNAPYLRELEQRWKEENP